MPCEPSEWESLGIGRRGRILIRRLIKGIFMREGERVVSDLIVV